MTIDEVVRRISYFRNKAGLSARDLSLMLGKNESYINKLEIKEFNLPVKVLLDILECLGVSVEEFFSSNYENFKTENELRGLIKNLSKEQMEALLKLLK